jgi:hypothetical protein
MARPPAPIPPIPPNSRPHFCISIPGSRPKPSVGKRVQGSARSVFSSPSPSLPAIAPFLQHETPLQTGFWTPALDRRRHGRVLPKASFFTRHFILQRIPRGTADGGRRPGSLPPTRPTQSGAAGAQLGLDRRRNREPVPAGGLRRVSQNAAGKAAGPTPGRNSCGAWTSPTRITAG